MRLSSEETIKQMLDKQELFVIYSAVPQKDGDGIKMLYKNAMLMEAPVTNLAQVWIYDSKDACVAAVKELSMNKQYCASVSYVKEAFRIMLLELAELGAETVLYHSGEDVGEAPMSDEAIVKLMKVENVSVEQRELSRDVQLLWQCASRNHSVEEGKLSSLDQEEEVVRRHSMTGSLMRGGLLVPVVPNQEVKGQFNVPIFQEKDAEGNVTERQLLGFTNRLELARYFGKQIPPCALWKIEDIKNLVDRSADVLLVNKATTGLRFGKAILEQIVRNKEMISNGKELTEDGLIVHLTTDRAYYTIYGGTMSALPDTDKTEIRIRGPYIVEEEETLDDQFYIFADREEAQEFRKKILQEKKLFTCVREWRTRDFISLYATLASLAVNTIVYKTDGKEYKLDMEKLYRLPDYSMIESDRRPLINPSLALSAQYYWQELTRMIKLEDRSEEDKKVLTERNAEFLGNLVKASFYIRVMEQEVDGEKKVVFPMTTKRDNEGNVISAEFQLFSDIYELRLYFGKNLPRVVKIPFTGLGELLNTTECTGVIINPGSTGLHYTEEMMARILGLA